jgi:hypothetical protein
MRRFPFVALFYQARAVLARRAGPGKSLKSCAEAARVDHEMSQSAAARRKELEAIARTIAPSPYSKPIGLSVRTPL